MTPRRWLGITTPDWCIFSEAPRVSDEVCLAGPFRLPATATGESVWVLECRIMFTASSFNRLSRHRCGSISGLMATDCLAGQVIRVAC